MQLEELKEFRSRAEAPDEPERRRDRSRPTHFGKPRDFPKGPRFTRYTSLTAERSRVLEEALNADLLKAPSRTPTPQSADQTKHCRYHRNFGHTTEDCWALKDKIEELIQADHLQRFVQTGREDGKNEVDMEKREGRRDTQVNEQRGRRGREGREGRGGRDRRRTMPVRGVINTIAGGFAGGGTTSSSRKRHLRAVSFVYSISRRNRRDLPPMLFTNSDFRNINPRHDDPIVVTIKVANFVVMKTLIDQGSSVDILYWKTFRKMGISDDDIVQYDEQIIGFAGQRVNTRGYIDLDTKFGEGNRDCRTIKIRYLLVDAETSYNILIGRSSLNKLGAIVSTPHLAMKFPADNPSRGREVVTLHADQKTARECYAASLKILSPSTPTRRTEVHHISLSDNLDPRPNDEPQVEQKEEVVLCRVDRAGQNTRLGSTLGEEGKSIITTVLFKNTDLFAWSAADMPGIDPRIISHQLSICKEARPIAQKKRKFVGEKGRIVEEETRKLLDAGFIREVHYTTWLANIVLVQKNNGKWRMCTDYTHLNRACPKDAYPLLSIDRLVDGAAGHKVLSFLDAYSGYNQIRMNPADREKTAFITDRANFCYEVMPFSA